MKKWLDSQEFYELCQVYRHINIMEADQAFEQLKKAILKAAENETREGSEARRCVNCDFIGYKREDKFTCSNFWSLIKESPEKFSCAFFKTKEDDLCKK